VFIQEDITVARPSDLPWTVAVMKDCRLLIEDFQDRLGICQFYEGLENV